MIKKSILIGWLLLAVVGQVFSDEITKVTNNVNISGGFTTSLFYVKNNNEFVDGHEAIQVTDFIVDFKSGEVKSGDIGFATAFGIRKGHNIIDPTPEGSYRWEGIDFDYGYAIYRINNEMSLTLGSIFTTIGYEYSPNYKNKSIMRGVLWSSQPGAYEGARFNYAFANKNISAEVNYDKSQFGYVGAKRTNWAISTNGNAVNVNYSLSYYDGKNSRNIVDLMLNTKVASLDLGFNMDYFVLDNRDDNFTAIGMAFYLSTTWLQFEFPLRIEYVSDGDSNVYGNANGNVDAAYTITFSPSYHQGKNAYLRVELVWVSSKNEIFVDDSGAAKSGQVSLATQLGYEF